MSRKFAQKYKCLKYRSTHLSPFFTLADPPGKPTKIKKDGKKEDGFEPQNNQTKLNKLFISNYLWYVKEYT